MTPELEVLIENLITYGIVFIIVIGILVYYIKGKKKSSKVVEEKINKAREMGFYEPVSLHPVVDHDICIGSGACIAACPEKDILGIVNGKATTINASRCVGHGACFHACPVEAITLVMGTEKRGVELPHVTPKYETNVEGIYIAGELGGMGLIKNAVEQGKQAVQNIHDSFGKQKNNCDYDIFIIGSGPAGIAGTLMAAKLEMKYRACDQDTIGGTVFSFPRSKIVMTNPMDIPLHGMIKLTETSKTELIELWQGILKKNNITINENEKVLSVKKQEEGFLIKTSKGEFTSRTVLLAIGRRGSPRKLGVKGENREKVSYRLLEPELIHNEKILVVGGGDSAVENAMMLADENNDVTLAYRSEAFKRIKPKNLERINQYSESGKISVRYSTNISEIKEDTVVLAGADGEEEIDNSLVYIFAGGELPNKFLADMGINISKKFGEAVLKHQK
ncbi:MAG: hypothetical protein SCALA702_34420 [Melioribacteraceae bacterium]|nr:MAG: hypothetical protein SCALA702_34420 [Melioribacteraceae bacterium]